MHDVTDIKEDGTISYIEPVPPYEGINELGKRKAEHALCYSPENTLLTADKGKERYTRIDGSTVCGADEYFVYSNKANNSVLSVYNKEYCSETKDNKTSEIAKKSIIFGENNKQLTGVSVKNTSETPQYILKQPLQKGCFLKTHFEKFLF